MIVVELVIQDVFTLDKMDKKRRSRYIFLRYKGRYANFKRVSKVYNITCENETAGKEIYIKRDRQTDRERDRESETERESDRDTERERERKRERQREIERERNRETEREGERNREREREGERER